VVRLERFAELFVEPSDGGLWSAWSYFLFAELFVERAGGGLWSALSGLRLRV
jgi:hypothetical protein